MKANARTSARAADDDAGTLLDILGSLIAEVGDRQRLGLISLDVSLERELGLGSLERVELFGRIESAFSVRLPPEALSAAETPREILDLVRGRRAADPDARGEPAAPAREGGATPGEAAGRRTAPLGMAIRPAAPPPERARTLLEVLEYRAVRDPDRVHLLVVHEDGSEDPITFAELRREAGAMAVGLRELLTGPAGGWAAAAEGALRPAVAIMLPTRREYFAAFFGALLAGAVPVPLYPPLRLDRIAEYVGRQSRILENAGAEVLVTFERAARVGALARDRAPSLRHVVAVERFGRAGENGAVGAIAGPGDTALIQYTSGSTGDPRGVELTHANVLANIRAATTAVALSSTDVLVSWLPLYHDMGLIAGWLMNLYIGSPAVLLSPLRFLSRPETWFETITRHRATRSVAPNFAFELAVRRVGEEVLARIDLRSLRTVLNGSEPILPATLERFAARFAPAGFKRTAMFPAYGLAENMVAVAFPPIDREPRIDTIERGPFEREGRAVPAAPRAIAPLRFVSVGAAVPDHEIRLVDEQGSEVGERRQGRLQFRGPSVFKGYLGNPEATARVKLEGGWVDSGDLAYRAAGEFFITGRVKDIIIKAGRNYYPHELEAAAGAVPGVRQGCVAAFGLSDQSQGTESIVIVAETRLVETEARDDLARHVREAILTAVGVPPDRVVLVPPGAVPKTSSGKVKRTETRSLYLRGDLGKERGSAARQAARLYLRWIPARLGARVRRAAEIAYGGYAASVFVTILADLLVAAPCIPSGRPLRLASVAAARAALALSGLRPWLSGEEKIPAGATILVANHASYLDPFVLAAVLPADVRFVVKAECRDVFLIGPALRRAGHVMIERRDAGRSLEGLREIAGLLERGARVVLFPEGTFAREVGLRPFKLGAFRLACDCSVPVVPVVIRGTRRALRDGMWLPRRVPIDVEVLDPVRPAGADLGDVIRLRDQAAGAMAARLDEPRLDLFPPEPR